MREQGVHRLIAFGHDEYLPPQSDHRRFELSGRHARPMVSREDEVRQLWCLGQSD